MLSLKQNSSLMIPAIVIRNIALMIGLSMLGQCLAAQDSLTFFQKSKELNKSRVVGVVVGSGVGHAGSLIALNALWYKDYPRTKFHFFNDNADWLGMDKVGHAMTSYYVGYLGMEALDWAGLDKMRSIWYGGNIGLAFLTTVEILDGYSSQWGASAGDIAANFGGTALLIGQELAWDEQRILLKFSANLSPFAKYRPALLGTTVPERLLKDYNGQTYWLSVNVASFLRDETGFPKWLNLAVGYSADGLTGGSANPTINEQGQYIPAFARRSQFFISPDIDLRRIKTKSRFLKAVLVAANFIKVPLPAFEIPSSGSPQFLWLYF